MKRPRLQPVLAWLKGVITQPREELDRWERAARFVHDLFQHGTTQLRRDRAPQMAGALAFRTLFGLLPVLVMGAVVVRALGGPESFIASLTQIIEGAGLYEVGSGEGNSLGSLLEDLVKQAAHYSTAAIGWIGLGVLIYSAISLMVTIENSFNSICRAPEGRPWTKQFPMYWFILTVGPVAIGASIYLNGKVAGVIDELGRWTWVIQLAAGTWEFLVTWLLMVVVYGLVPNTNMRLRPVMIGALVAALLLSLGKHVLGAYLANAVSVTQFSGSLGLIPLFMFWVYVMWLVVLFGLEVAATLQMLAGRKLEQIEQRGRSTGLVDPVSIVVVMEAVVARFHRSAATTAAEAAEATGLPEVTVTLMLERLVEAGLLHRLDRDDRAVSLARPPEQIAAAELIDAGFALVDQGGVAVGSPLLERLRDAQRALAGSATLTDLLALPPAATVADQVRGSR